MQQPISLPLLDELIKNFSYQMPSLNKIVFVCVQHIITTTAHLFKSLLQLGALPHNIFIAGKYYSTSPAIFGFLSACGIQMQTSTDFFKYDNYATHFINDLANMWIKVEQHISKNKIEAIIILDDGGRCLECLPLHLLKNFPIIGIEQTTAGIKNLRSINSPVSFVDVAGSAAKKFLEPPVIIDEIVKRAKPYLRKNMVCGIIGFGVIGKVLSETLEKMENKVLIYDPFRYPDIFIKKFERVMNIQDIFNLADCIFGCTGEDITKEIDFSNFCGEKILISCSSEDKEFFSLIQKARNLHKISLHGACEDVVYINEPNKKLQILNGGFPINFSRKKEIARPVDIQLTRGLLLSSIMQATYIFSKKIPFSGRIMLSSNMQKFIAERLPIGTWSAEDLEYFKDLNWIIKNSSGAPIIHSSQKIFN